MKKMILAAGLLFALMGTGMATEPAATASAPEAAASTPDTQNTSAEKPLLDIPAGAMVRTDETSLAYFVVAKASIPTDVAIYRPSENMPEASPQFLRDQIAGVATTPFMGYLPRLKIYPCADDCSGSDFDKAIQRFLKGWESFHRDGRIKWRGEMPVEVRWFKTKSMFVPLSTNSFGISFVYEGKLVSLGKTSSSVSGTTIGGMAEDMGQRLAYEMLFRAGLGLRPRFLNSLDPNTGLNQVTAGIGDVNAGIRSLVGGQDARSRIEVVDPVKNKRLLATVDGIQPGEVRPITEMHYLPNF